MALRNKSLFLYGFQVTELNRAIDFLNVNLGTEIQASVELGFYSLNGLLAAISQAMNDADPTETYVASVNRNVMGGLENRVSISTGGAFLSLLFSTGTRAGSSIASLIGFTATDFTGAVTYQGSSSAGTVLIPSYVGYNYLGPEFIRKNFGAVNISTSGDKETIVYNIQKFWQVQFKFEPQAFAISDWQPFLEWAIQQKPLEFTPDITAPLTFYEGTLESTSNDGQGLSYTMNEMLPDFPFEYDMGLMKFRQRNT